MKLSYHKHCYGEYIYCENKHFEMYDRDLNEEQKNERNASLLKMFSLIVEKYKHDLETLYREIYYASIIHMHEDVELSGHKIHLVKELPSEGDDGYQSTIAIQVDGQNEFKLSSEEASNLLLAIFDHFDDEDRYSLIESWIKEKGTELNSHSCDQCGDYNYNIEMDV